MRRIELKKSASAIIIRIILLLFLIDTVFALLIFLFLRLSPPTQYYPAFLLFLWLLHTVKYLVITFILMRLLLAWLRTSYLILGQQLFITAGIYALTEKVLSLDQIKHLTIHQDWIGRRFGYGTITFQVPTAGAREVIELDDIIDPFTAQRDLLSSN